MPGSVGILVSLTVMTQISLTTPYAVLLAAHVLLMVSLAALFTPVFTLGLGAVPMHLYSHASSLLGTLQQVAAAFGTALVVTVMSSRAVQLAGLGAGEAEAMLGGLRWAFWIGAGALGGRGRAGAPAARPAAGPTAQPEPVEDLAPDQAGGGSGFGSASTNTRTRRPSIRPRYFW